MMEPEKEALLHQRQLAFIGRMLTAFAQRMPDHLAPLQASADRLADLLDQAGQGTEETNGKLADLLSTMESHLGRLARKTQHIQWLGQRMGARVSPFNPVEVIEEAIFFSVRQAHLCKASIRLEAGKSLPSLKSDPVSIHFLVSMAINRMLAWVGEGGELLVRAGAWEKGICITVAGHGTLESTTYSEGEIAEQDWSMGQELAASLGGCLQPATLGHDTGQVSIYLPMERDLKQC